MFLEFAVMKTKIERILMDFLIARLFTNQRKLLFFLTFWFLAFLSYYFKYPKFRLAGTHNDKENTYFIHKCTFVYLLVASYLMN